MKTLIKKAITAIIEGIFVLSLSALCCIGGEPCLPVYVVFGAFALSGASIALMSRAGWEV